MRKNKRRSCKLFLELVRRRSIWLLLFNRRASMNDNIFSITVSLLIQQCSKKRSPWLETMTTLLQLCRTELFFDRRFDYSRRFFEMIVKRSLKTKRDLFIYHFVCFQFNCSITSNRWHNDSRKNILFIFFIICNSLITTLLEL